MYYKNVKDQPPLPKNSKLNRMKSLNINRMDDDAEDGNEIKGKGKNAYGKEGEENKKLNFQNKRKITYNKFVE
jgi:hypothetical protein